LFLIFGELGSGIDCSWSFYEENQAAAYPNSMTISQWETGA